MPTKGGIYSRQYAHRPAWLRADPRAKMTARIIELPVNAVRRAKLPSHSTSHFGRSCFTFMHRPFTASSRHPSSFAHCTTQEIPSHSVPDFFNDNCTCLSTTLFGSEVFVHSFAFPPKTSHFRRHLHAASAPPAHS